MGNRTQTKETPQTREKMNQEGNRPVEYKKLTREDLEKLAGEPLPERAAMSLINANVAAPINAAIALNVASDNSIAFAQATQDVQIDQST